ncbi:DoxX family protein [Aestuariimicrobium ganziense]|uniref:DoxX family protein n=1 Tax=Aestuariimicrobium ganziense TaxID=2773677 RepID=UPI00194352CE|nr:DoxX family protein [Aestuariimicrobium ganziense]
MADERHPHEDERPTLAEKIMSEGSDAQPDDQQTPNDQQATSDRAGTDQHEIDEAAIDARDRVRPDEQAAADPVVGSGPGAQDADERRDVDASDAGDDEPTRVHDRPVVDDEPTQVVAATPAGADPEPTAVMYRDEVANSEADEAERARLEQEREAALAEQRRRDAEEDRRRRAEAHAERQRRLGVVTPAAEPEPARVVAGPRITDRFLGSLGLMLLRLVTAGIMGIHGFQKLTTIEETTDFFGRVGLPQPGLWAWGVGIAELLAAVALVFGFAVRLAGLGIAAIAIGALTLVHWGAHNPFRAGESGFVGELELLLAAVGLSFAALGGGGWGIDAGMRRGRARRRAQT